MSTVTEAMIAARAKELGDKLVTATVIGVQQSLSGQMPVLGNTVNYRMVLYAQFLLTMPPKPALQHTELALEHLAETQLNEEIKSNTNIN